MRRRDFIRATAAVTTTWPFAARAQQPARMRRVGVLLPFDENDPEVINSDVKPGLSQVALMFNPDTAPFLDPYYRSFKAMPQQSSVEVDVAHVRTAGEIVSAIAKLGSEQGSALILGSDVFLVNMREPIIRLANERGELQRQCSKRVGTLSRGNNRS